MTYQKQENEMKKTVLMAILLYLALPLGLQAEPFEISLSGGSEIYADTAAFGGSVGLDTLLGGVVPGFKESALRDVFLGGTIFYYQGSQSGVDLSHAGGGLNLGYVFKIGESFRLIPLIFTGVSKGKSQTGSTVTLDSWGVSLMPGLTADYEITQEFLAGITAGYRIYVYPSDNPQVSGTIKGFLLSARLAFRIF